MTALVSTVRAWLPRGHRLPPEQWVGRHRAITTVVWLHVPAFLIWGLLKGFPVPHAIADIVPIVVPAFFASVRDLGRRAREAFAAIALLSASAILVHLMDGAIEAHFHFFLAVSLLALYEEWFPYLLAFAFVLVHHAAMSALSPHMVFSEATDKAHPWRWSLVHAAFIAAQGVICLVGWKVNEDARADAMESQQRFGSAFNDAPIGMALVDLDGTVLQANCELLSRWEAAQAGRPLVGSRLSSLVLDHDLDGTAFPGDEAELRHADGTGWGHWRHAPTVDADGRQTGWISHVIDVTTRKRLESDLSWQAHHDPLTGLPNRTLFMRELEAAVGRDEGAAVFFVDLDDFKLINDSLGHAAGDELLRAIGGRLTAALRPADVVARFGGDEFVVLATDIESEGAATRVAARVADALNEPVMLSGQDRYVAGSIGVRVRAAGSGLDADAVIRDADTAMYRAKAFGKGRCEIFDASIRDEAVVALELESSLRTVLDRDELHLVYQPLIDLPTGALIGVEALLRWNHPTIGFVPPLDFIPLAERNGTIVEIGAWVLDEACRQLKAWNPPAGFKVSVNVSSMQLERPNFPDTVRRILAEHDVDPSSVCLEVTETAILGDAETTTRTLAELTEIGVGLAVDDFGVGYASLLHLRQLLPVHTLKIDKSFVDGVLEGVEDAAIVEGVIRLAHSLGLDVVAEGVEHAEQADQLLDWGCEVGQGYHFDRPLPAGEITERLVAGPGAVDVRRAA
ncbi:MAG: EAL domain-containing protein [Solirubrobacteraceae bacterium]|nr:EAL domain-containing protein [Patulibacter sp.]